MSSSLSLGPERGLQTLRRELVEADPLQTLLREALDPLCTFSLTSGTRSLPSAARWRMERSRLGEERVGEWEEIEEGGVAV